MNRALGICAFLALVAFVSCEMRNGEPEPLPVKAHMIYAEIDPDSSFMSCQDVLSVDLGRERAGRFFFFLNESLRVDRLETGGGIVSFRTSAEPALSRYLRDPAEEDEDFYSNAAVVVLDLPSGDENVPVDGPRSLVVSYSGVLYDSLRVPDYSRGGEAEETRGLIDRRGTFLSPATHWYPSVKDGMCIFNITTATPSGYHSVAQGRLSSREIVGEKVRTVWKASAPSEEAYLVAGPYQIETVELDGTDVSTYFYESESDLSESYLQACVRYLNMYGELLGEYPYPKFAVVENFFPTGLGMPSYTLLGRRVLRLPFIVHTSLGHEIAHNWWGNGVYVDPAGGNWCEGLTTYCADYRYKLLESEESAREYRRNINRDFTVYVTPENDMPLTEFEERTTRATRAIGYGKCAMVFHMLERELGEEKFFETLRAIVSKYKFEQIGWSEIREEFSRAQGRDLGWFFDQWVAGAGAPRLKIASATARDTWPDYTLFLTIEQEGGPFRMDVPVVVRTVARRLSKTVEIDGPVASARFRCKERPLAVELDPGHNLMRRMADDEIAPALALVLADDETIFVVPSAASEKAAAAYAEFAQRLTRTGQATIVADTELTREQASSHSLFVLGAAGENFSHEMFGGKWPQKVFPRPGVFVVGENTYASAGDCVLFVGRNPFNRGKTVALLGGLSAEAVLACSGKIVHYGKYGYVVFSSGRAVDKGTWEIQDCPRKTVTLERIG